jgi:hypothetical protein
MSIVSMVDGDGTRWFFEWSSIVDAPITAAMTEAELLEYYPRRRAEQAAEEARGYLERELGRIKSYGTSSRLKHTAEDTIGICNRAGEGETWLSAEQQLELCVRRRDDPAATMPGTPQDMVCCVCCRPIEGERHWLGDDPACSACHQQIRKP